MAEGELMPYDLIVVKDMTEKFEHIIEKERMKSVKYAWANNPLCSVGDFESKKSIIKIIKKTLIENLHSGGMMN